MEKILYNISQVLGVTIIASLWQALVVYFLLRTALLLLPRMSSPNKYFLSAISLLAITVWFSYTLVNEIHIYNWLAKPVTRAAMPYWLELPSGIRVFNDQTLRYYYLIEPYLPYITSIYVAGLLFNTSRLVVARQKIHLIARTMSIDVPLQHEVNQFANLMKLGKKVRIGLTNLIDVPCTAGFFKPVIFLPFSLTTLMSPDEVEAILLHELAHIKRNDYLVNLLQQVISILLFFNPCARLISRLISEERENSCDDLVLDAFSNPVVYAKALLKLQETNLNNWNLALPASGKKYYLLNRIRRIMKTKNTIPSMRPALIAMLMLSLGIGCIALLNPNIAQGKISVKAIAPIIRHFLADTDTTVKNITKAVPIKRDTGERRKITATADSLRYFKADHEKKLQELSAEIQKHADYLQKYYMSDSFKMVQREIEQKTKALQEYFNSAEVKKVQHEMAQLSEHYAKTWSQDDKLNGSSVEMTELGKSLGAYYSSAKFKKMNEELRKKYGIANEQTYFDDRKDENYRKYQAELNSSIPAEIKRQAAQLTTVGRQLSTRYDSPKFKEQNERMKRLGDSLKKVYENSALQYQEKDMKVLEEQMKTFQNNPQLKREQELINEYVKKMTAYLKSAEYQSYLNSKFNYDFDFNLDSDKQKEKAEKAEKAEKNEKKDHPDNER